MTSEEWSREFDILWNNITSNQAPSLNDYEKSVFCTEALENQIISIYRGSVEGMAFESSEELTSYLSRLVKTHEFSQSDGTPPDIPATNYFICTDFMLPDDLWFIVYETANVASGDGSSCWPNGREVDVVPVTHDTLRKTFKNPFRFPNRSRVLRVTKGENDRVSELISDGDVQSYVVRYLRRPKPMILGNISEYGLTVNGYNETASWYDPKNPCELGDNAQRAILMTAVQLAKNTWANTVTASK